MIIKLPVNEWSKLASNIKWINFLDSAKDGNLKAMI